MMKKHKTWQRLLASAALVMGLGVAASATVAEEDPFKVGFVYIGL